MNESISSTSDSSRFEFLKCISQFDDPAFLRRARSVAAAWDTLDALCQHHRRELLEMPRLRLAMLGQLVQHRWSSLAPCLQNESHTHLLADWFAQWQPRLRGTMDPTDSPRKLRSALRELTESVERFNDRWHSYLLSVDRAPINRLRHDYNRYYVLEKSCALDCETMAAAGFEPLPAVTVEQLLEHFPLLEVPQLRH
jgi:hypothetical protein